MKRNMLTRRVGSLFVIRENTEDPTDADWDEFLVFLRGHLSELQRKSLKILVYTDGGAANAPQRKRLAETLGNTHGLVAVVSNSIKVRFAGATIALFQRNYRQFAVDEMRRAFDHLGLSHEERRIAEDTLYELEAVLYRELI